MKWLLGPYADRRTYKVFLFLLLGLPLGIIEFTLMVTGLSLGLGLAVTLIGIPFIVFTLLVARGLSAVERELASSMLGARMPRIGWTDEGKTGGWFSRAWSVVKSGRTWTAVAYLILRLPVGTLDFTVAVTLISLALAGPAQSILIAVGVKSDVGLWWSIDTFAESLVFWPVSALFVLVGPRLMLAWSDLSKHLAVSMLGRISPRQMKAAVIEVLGRLEEADGFAILDELALRLGDSPYLTPTRVEATLLGLVSNGHITQRQVDERMVYALR